MLLCCINVQTGGFVCRTAAKMAQKYGKFSQAVDFMEGRRWYNWFRKE